MCFTTSLSLSEYMKEFVCSTVVGKDLIPRLGLVNLERLKKDMIRVVNRCRHPKVYNLCTLDTMFSNLMFFLKLHLVFHDSYLLYSWASYCNFTGNTYEQRLWWAMSKTAKVDVCWVFGTGPGAKFGLVIGNHSWKKLNVQMNCISR